MEKRLTKKNLRHGLGRDMDAVAQDIADRALRVALRGEAQAMIDAGKTVSPLPLYVAEVMQSVCALADLSDADMQVNIQKEDGMRLVAEEIRAGYKTPMLVWYPDKERDHAHMVLVPGSLDDGFNGSSFHPHFLGFGEQDHSSIRGPSSVQDAPKDQVRLLLRYVTLKLMDLRGQRAFFREVARGVPLDHAVVSYVDDVMRTLKDVVNQHVDGYQALSRRIKPNAAHYLDIVATKEKAPFLRLCWGTVAGGGVSLVDAATLCDPQKGPVARFRADTSRETCVRGDFIQVIKCVRRYLQNTSPWLG